MNLTQDTLEGGVFPKAKSTESSQYGTYTPSLLSLQQLSLVLYKTSVKHLLLYNFNLAKSVIHFKEINRRNSILGCTISSDLKWKSLFDVLSGSCQELESVGMNKL